MRWLAKPSAKPKDGDTRTRYPFAWRPTRVGSCTVWLEKYQVDERFFAPISGDKGWWSEFRRAIYNPIYY